MAPKWLARDATGLNKVPSQPRSSCQDVACFYAKEYTRVDSSPDERFTLLCANSRCHSKHTAISRRFDNEITGADDLAQLSNVLDSGLRCQAHAQGTDFHR